MVKDITESSPGVNDVWVNHNIEVYFADQTGTSNDPKLVITYSLSSGTVANIPTLLTLGVG
jgi:hypothetical protein